MKFGVWLTPILQNIAILSLQRKKEKIMYKINAYEIIKIIKFSKMKRYMTLKIFTLLSQHSVLKVFHVSFTINYF